MSEEPPPVYRTVAAGGPLATPHALLPDGVAGEEVGEPDVRVDVGVAPRCAEREEP